MSKTKPSLGQKQPLQRFACDKSQPGARVSMDIGTLPWSDGMFRYFTLMVDLFSRYVEKIPLQDQMAESITQAFKVGWVFRGHGIPEVLLTDQGKNVDGHEVREMFKKLGIHKRHSSPYHHQVDGMAERNIGTAKQLICSLLMERKMEKGAYKLSHE